MAEPMNDPVTGLIAGQQADAATGGTGGMSDGVTARIDTTDQMADTVSGASADAMDSGMGAGLGGGKGSAGVHEETTGIREHMEVVGSDGDHVGVVDHVNDGQIKLTRNDANAGGKHHLISTDMVQSVDSVVRLNVPGRIAREQWQAAD